MATKVPDADPIIDLLRSFAIRCGPHRVVDFLDALTVFPGDHIAALAEALIDQDDELRLLAVEVLYAMGSKAEPLFCNQSNHQVFSQLRLL